MADVIEQLTAADPELSQPTDPERPPADLFASIVDGTDIVFPVSEIDSAPSPRRSRRPLVAAFAGFSAVLVVGAVTFLAIDGGPGGPGDEVTSGDTNALITSEMILGDGVVTEEEYGAGVEAVVVCLADVGFEVVADFDNRNGHAGFSGGDTGASTPGEDGPYATAFDRCLEVHLSNNVSLGWNVTLGRSDLSEIREQSTAVFECVTSRTGQDFGELTYDSFGYITEQGRSTRDAAFEYQDHQPWMTCQNDLGYLDEMRADTKAILECIEKRTGEDFGELTYDDTGWLDEEGLLTQRAATTYQNDVPWNTCVEELGLY